MENNSICTIQILNSVADVDVNCQVFNREIMKIALSCFLLQQRKNLIFSNVSTCVLTKKEFVSCSSTEV